MLVSAVPFIALWGWDHYFRGHEGNVLLPDLEPENKQPNVSDGLEVTINERGELENTSLPEESKPLMIKDETETVDSLVAQVDETNEKFERASKNNNTDRKPEEENLLLESRDVEVSILPEEPYDQELQDGKNRKGPHESDVEKVCTSHFGYLYTELRKLYK